MEEIWKDIKGYKGFYQVSNLGRVRSIDRYITNRLGVTRLFKGQIRKLTMSEEGYYTINLSKDNHRFNAWVHRLVAEAFIPNPLNLPIINHKDENKSNNSLNNLEWCDYQYNNTYNNIHIKGKETWRIKFENGDYGDIYKNQAICVVQLSLEGNLIKIWNSMMDVERELYIKSGWISECCKNNRKMAGRYKWMYYEDYIAQQNANIKNS